MKQRTLAMMTGFERYTKKTRRAVFLEEMEQVVPWRELCALIEPHYPQPGNGRPPIGVERMLRIYFLQQWFNLSDPAVEEALYDSSAIVVGGVIDDDVVVAESCHPLEVDPIKKARYKKHADVTVTLFTKESADSYATRLKVKLLIVPGSKMPTFVSGAGVPSTLIPTLLSQVPLPLMAWPFRCRVTLLAVMSILLTPDLQVKLVPRV